MIDLQTLKQTVKKEKPEDIFLNRQKEYLNSIENGVKEAYRIGCTYYSFNTDEDLYDSYQLKKEMKALGYKVELQREHNSWYGRVMPVRMTIRWED